MSEVAAARQETTGRQNQRNRTRDAILQAGAELLRLGPAPSVVEAAAAARVSQATAYRYFPTHDALVSAIIDREMRSALLVLHRNLERTGDPEEDIVGLADAILDEIWAKEPQHRSFLGLTLDQWFRFRRGESSGSAMSRGGRIAYLMDALEPLRAELGDGRLLRLAQALSLAIGIEGHIALSDVWDLPHAEARNVIRWTCRALVRQSLADDEPSPRPSRAARAALERSRRRRAATLDEPPSSSPGPADVEDRF